MDAFLILALVGIALLLAELLLSTGGVLAVLGAAGLIAGGILALGAEGGAPDWVGAALITLGALSGLSFVFIARKVIAAHREEPVRTGYEQLTGALAEARTPLDPEGQVWIEGSLWRARLGGDGAPPRPGDRVRVEAVDGLTLVVRPEPPPGAPESEQGAD
jgi:membrane-bound serine protease (ClpP class)